MMTDEDVQQFKRAIGTALASLAELPAEQPSEFFTTFLGEFRRALLGDDNTRRMIDIDG